MYYFALTGGSKRILYQKIRKDGQYAIKDGQPKEEKIIVTLFHVT
jgi:hypothetical protein